MDLDDYQLEISQIRFGKRVGTSVYFHKCCLPDLPPSLSALTNEAGRSAQQAVFPFNVYKLDTRAPMVSLLNYPEFFEEAFPKLAQSAMWDMQEGTLNVRHYPTPDACPILHRKELLLPLDHHKIEEFAAVTELAEQEGLFSDPSRIGRYGYWQSVLAERGIKIEGHALYRANGERIELQASDLDVQRYKTALKRNRLSVPIQMLYKHELLDERTSLFDYGCGRGDDVRQLVDLGVSASGWDPYYADQEAKRRADVVNLGYVVNVVEDIEERRQTLKDAFSYAKRLLVVSALSGNTKFSPLAKPYKDGVLTTAGTFQRYYRQDELAELIRGALAVEPISVAPGVMFVFADEEAENTFVASRLRRRRSGTVRSIIRNLEELSESAQLQAEEYWRACIELGRPADKDEAASCEELFHLVPSTNKLFDLISKDKDAGQFEAARETRKSELLVQFAMSHFGKKLFFKYFPDDLKRDIRFHFGNYSDLAEESKRLLYSIADTEALAEACSQATDDGIGYLLDDQALQMHISLLARVAPMIRVYAGCAGLLYGDWGQIDLVKIHIHSGKVSFMGYDDFEGKPVPDLIERIKVKLWQRKVDFFDYIGEFVPTPLLMKSLFIDDSFDYFEDQASFDQSLLRTRLFDFVKDNVSKAQFETTLKQAGYRVEGYELVKAA